jgi:hypothetical protein
MKNTKKTDTAVKTEAPVVLTPDQIAQIAAGMVPSGGTHITRGRSAV